MDIVISNIGQLITPIEQVSDEAGSRYEIRITTNTKLHIRNGRICPEWSNRTADREIDANGGLVLPGLIDPCWIMPRVPDWIYELPESTFPDRDLLSWNLRLLRRVVRTGVTAIEIKCSPDSALQGLNVLGQLTQQHYPRVIGTLLASLVENEADHGCSVSVLIGEVIPEIRRRRLATFCDIGWDNHAVYMSDARAVLRAAGGAGLRLKLHTGSSSLPEDIELLALSLDVAAVGCGWRLPVNVAQTLAASHVVPVYLPTVGGERADIDVRMVVDRDLPIAVGSGNGIQGSSSSSMWSVMAAAMSRMGLSLSEAIVSCTLNNALALDMEHETGSLENGKRADLILLNLADYREIELLMGCPPVSMVMVNGQVVPLT